MHTIEEQLETSKSLTAEVISRLLNTTDLFGEEYKAGDKLLHVAIRDTDTLRVKSLVSRNVDKFNRLYDLHEDKSYTLFKDM